jgi:hypothetical protein
MTKNEINFPVIDSLKRGGLSLWLNRTALLPLTSLPLGVTFITLSLLRTYAPDDMSYFMQAVCQIPADFAIGLFCSLIIVIIMNAPKKDSKDPVKFTMNLADKKRLMLAGAVAHTVFGYLYMGGFALTDQIAAPLRMAAESEQAVRMDLTLLVIAMLVIGLYAVRFALLPVLAVADMDIKDFYTRFKKFGLSFPILFIKIATMLAVGTVLILPLSSMAPPEGESLNLIDGVVIDILAAMAAVFSHAWAYAAMAIGVRHMMEGKPA